MTAAAMLRLAVSMLLLCALFWAFNGTLFLFNHPRFPGEASLALIAALLLVAVFVWACVLLLRWFRASLR